MNIKKTVKKTVKKVVDTISKMFSGGDTVITKSSTVITKGNITNSSITMVDDTVIINGKTMNKDSMSDSDKKMYDKARAKSERIIKASNGAFDEFSKAMKDLW